VRRLGVPRGSRQPAAILPTSSRRARCGAASGALLNTRLDPISIAPRLSSGFVQPVFSPPSRRRTSRHLPTSSRRAGKLKTLCVLRPAPLTQNDGSYGRILKVETAITQPIRRRELQVEHRRRRPERRREQEKPGRVPVEPSNALTPPSPIFSRSSNSPPENLTQTVILLGVKTPRQELAFALQGSAGITPSSFPRRTKQGPPPWQPLRGKATASTF
jgi:hypothetical protein